MLRKLRIIFAALFLVGITLLLVGIGRDWWGWMASLQFLPSLLALNLPVLLGILLLTLLLGRLYCSVICPLGVFQDVVIWLRRGYGRMRTRGQAARLRKLKAAGKPIPAPRKFAKEFSLSKEHRIVRFSILVLCFAGMIASVQFLLTLLAPYSAYGRFVRSIVGVADGESVAPAMLITAAVTFVLLVFLAWTRGRAWCNTICPVGSLLSIVSRFAIFGPVIDESKCVSCKKCGKNCKSSCIDMENHRVNMADCVVCFDCLDNCSEGAITIGRRRTGKPAAPGAPADKSRRTFIATGAALIGGSIVADAQNKRLDGGLAEVVDKQTPKRERRIVPAGALSIRHFARHCTACQLCVSSCPNGVLKTSRDLEFFLQPEMDFSNGYCRPECTACADICPTDAIGPIQKDEKLNIRIGLAQVNLELCFAAQDKENCGNCATHCPSGAIRMIEADGYSRRIPSVDWNQCIGCGACDFLCPSRPISAITVNGLSTHINRS